MTVHEYLATPSVKVAAVDAQSSPETRNHLQWLNERVSGCIEDNWDGEGATAVSGQALSAAAAFLARLGKERLRQPDAEADNDGWVTLEWFLSADNVVLVSFGPGGAGTYASLLKGVGCCGKFNALQETVDGKVLALLRQFGAACGRA